MDTEALLKMGLELVKTGKHIEAIKCFDKAIEVDPAFAEAQYQKGMVLMTQREYAQATEAFDDEEFKSI
jgi:tetratricopeptide (TPR) repeat protein